MSARSVPSSQRTTASRKLAIITPDADGGRDRDHQRGDGHRGARERGDDAARRQAAEEPEGPAGDRWSRRSSTSDAAGGDEARSRSSRRRGPRSRTAMPPPDQDRIAAPPARSPRPTHVARVADRARARSRARRGSSPRAAERPSPRARAPSAASAVAPSPSSTPLPSVERVEGDVAHREHEVEVVDRARHEAEQPLRHAEPQQRGPRPCPRRRSASASPITSAKISARDTPRARSEPMSGRRCTTENVMVL